VIPGAEAFRRADARFALGFWPWSLLAQPEPLPERLISADPEAIVDHALGEWGSAPGCIDPEARAAYVAALRNRDSVHAICEEYRAAATIDREHDEDDERAGRRIACPTLALWSEEGPLDSWYEAAGGPLAIWRTWARDVTGRPIRGGHFFPEANADETLAELRAFV